MNRKDKSSERIVVVKIIKEYTKEEWDSFCNHCGSCCQLLDYKDGQVVQTGDCQYLRHVENGRTECSIYEVCYGTQLNSTTWCVPIENVYKRSPNCPYNQIIGKNEVFRLQIDDS